MMPSGELERSLRSQAVMTTAVAFIAVVAAAVWAAVPPPLPAPPAKTVAAESTAPVAGANIDTRVWQVALWRPFSDAPPPPPKAVPLTLKVFSILRQSDGLTAAIDPGGGGGLVYAKTGQRVGEHLVTAVDANGIEIEIHGRRQRVELRP